MRNRDKTKPDTPATPRKAAAKKASALRSLTTAILVGSVRASAGRSGVAGMAGAFVFERVLRRSPLGALAIGAALIGRDLYKSGRKAREKREAEKALQIGIASVPSEPSVSLASAPAAPRPMPFTRPPARS